MPVIAEEIDPKRGLIRRHEIHCPDCGKLSLTKWLTRIREDFGLKDTCLFCGKEFVYQGKTAPGGSGKRKEE